MMQTEQIAKIKAPTKIAEIKKTTAAPSIEKNAPTDKLTLSADAKQAIEVSRFVEMLKAMPEVRNLPQELPSLSANALREVARKIAETL